MARGRPRGQDQEGAVISGLYDRILAQLKPDREITPAEFLKRAFTFPQIERIKIQKFAGGTWNFAEDITDVGPGFDPSVIEAHLKERYGAWRFRMLVILNGEVVTQHLINLDGWQENEARSNANLPSRPALTSGSRPAGPGATSELLVMAKERVEIENTTRLLQGLDRDRTEHAVGADLTPIRMMAEMMTGMMGMMKEFMTISRGGMGTAQEDRFVQYLTAEVQFMREQMMKPAIARDPDALTRTITTIDTILDKALGTSLAEVLSGNTGKSEVTGWAATIQGIMEGLKPYVPDLMAVIQAAASRGAVAPTGSARVIPFRAVAAAPPGPPSTTAEESGDMAGKVGVNPALIEIINVLIDALKSKNFETVDAVLFNPPLKDQLNINPNVAASTYVILYKNVDPRFSELGPEIAAYQEHMRRMIDEADKAEKE